MTQMMAVPKNRGEDTTSVPGDSGSVVQEWKNLLLVLVGIQLSILSVAVLGCCCCCTVGELVSGDFPAFRVSESDYFICACQGSLSF